MTLVSASLAVTLGLYVVLHYSTWKRHRHTQEVL